MDRDKFMRDFWDYYLMLEEDFNNTLRYIELRVENYNTFSKEYVKQCQSICAEIEVIFKRLSKIEADEKRKNIKDYAEKILELHPEIKDIKVKVLYTDMIILPFYCWEVESASQSLGWWKNYQGIKHNRILNFSDATLKNVLYALCALYVLEKLFYKTGNFVPDYIDKESNLFKIEDWKTNYIPLGGGLRGKIIG